MLSEKDPDCPEMIEDIPYGFMDYVNSLAPDSLSEMLGTRVIPSLIHTFRMHGLSEFSGIALRVWIADMLIDGFKGSTVKRYTGALHTLYKEWKKSCGLEEDDSIFSFSLSGFDSETSAARLKEVEDNLEAAERFVRISVKQDSPAFVFNKAFQYLMFDPFASLKDIATMRFSDQRPDSLHLEDLILSMRNAPQAKYVFPLQQGKRREGAIIKDLPVS